MSSEEDTELRDLVIKSLESNGVIGKIKAELRASVFLALEEEGSFRDKIPLVNKKLSDFAGTSEGVLTLSIIRDFLETFDLKFTQAVFDPEVSISAYLNRTEICRKLKLSNVNDGEPIISEILKEGKFFNCSADDKLINHSSQSNITKEVKNINFNSTFSIDDNLDNETDINFNKSLLSEADSVSAQDPFFDQPLPSEQHSLFASKKEFDFGFSKKESSTKPFEQPSSDQNSVFTSKREFDIPKKENKPFSLSLGTEAKKNESSLSSLQDLPSLTSKPTSMPDWAISKGRKKCLPSLDINTPLVTDDNHDDKKNAKSSSFSVDDEINENSEQSVNEEIEEDISVGLDDLLSSSSIGDDVTTEQTVSQVSVVDGVDYIESCDSTKS